MRLDAAPSSVYRSPRKAVGGVAPAAGATVAADGATAAADGTVAEPAPTPPPSIDGKGTLINTYG